ncbi:hypothetical protein ACOSQ4_015216 [Xanthoceras sorbifolium]
MYLRFISRIVSVLNPKEISNLYGLGGSRPKVGTFASRTAFTPEESVEFMCANARNFIRSIEGLGPGKLSNDDRMRITAFHTWMAFGSLRDLDVRLLQAEVAAKGAKAEEYKQRAKAARGMIRRLKKELPEHAIDQWLKSEEFMDAAGVEYQRGTRETKILISKVDPSFDLQKLEKVRTELINSAIGQPTEVAAEEDILEDSLDRTDVADSDEEEEEV